MKKFLIILTIVLTLQSCSTMRASKLTGMATGAVLCGLLGSGLGAELSPDDESKSFNKALGGATGAGVCGVVGYWLGGNLYQNDPRNFEDSPLKFDEKKNQEGLQNVLPEPSPNIDLSDLSYVKNLENEMPLMKGLPKPLKEKIKRQKVIRYKLKPQTIKTKDGRTLYFSGGEAIEHSYINQIERGE